MDPAARTLCLQSSVKLTRGSEDGQYASRGVGKQFAEAARVVLVWCSEGESDGKLFGSRDVRVHEVGWGVIEELPGGAATPPSSIFRIVMRMYPEVASSDASGNDDERGPRTDTRTISSLGDAIFGMYQQNLVFMQRAIETILLSVR